MSDATPIDALATLIGEARVAFLKRVPLGPNYIDHQETRIYPQPDNSEILVEISASEGVFELFVWGRVADGRSQNIGKGVIEDLYDRTTMTWQPIAAQFTREIIAAVMAAAKGEATL